MDRRSFLAWISLGSLATSLPVVLAACSTSETATDAAAPAEGAASSAAPETAAPETAAPETAAADGFVAVGPAASLEGGGSINEGKFAGGSGQLIVFKDGDNVVALDAKCPHAGCAVGWKDSELICPCHDSKFSVDGAVISGPASTGLAVFEAKIEGDQVLVKAG
ncbi:MAG: Rieske (2Fe-2S) protein [Synechococcales cyanobacterium RM1_1_8]|nr:Rieske (2Fe-2S) protein [Synechococcales cyanobacterium RM1_1_8]